PPTSPLFPSPTLFRSRDRATAAGIDAPIVPGILPVTNFEQVVKFSRLCGATVPEWMARLFADLDAEPETRQLVAASVAVELCHALRAEGVDDFHFYTLNRSQLTCAICRMLGISPATGNVALEAQPASAGA